MNTHEKIYKLLTNFALGELSEQQESQVKAHLAECEHCTEEAKQLAALLGCTEQIGAVDVGEDVYTSAKLAVLNTVTNKEMSTASRWRLSLENVREAIMKKVTARVAIAAVAILACAIGIGVFAYQNIGSEEGVIAQGDTGEGLKNTEAHVAQGRARAKELKLAEDMKRVEQMFAAGDTEGLVAMMSVADHETKAAAANYLSEVGDIAALEMLEALSESSTSEDANNPFGTAAEEVKDKLQIAAILTTEQELEGASSTQVVGDELLRLLPAETLFCVRMNNLDGTLGAIDQFIAGVSPVPGGAAMLVRMGLAGLVGDPALNGIDTKGNFAAFGAAITPESDTPSPGDVIVAVAIPVSDYPGFISNNAKCAPPDANGISIIHSSSMGGANKTMLATQSGAYMLVSSQSDYKKIVSLRDAPKGAGLADSLEAGELRNATEEAVWAYVDIQRTSKVFGPLVDKGLEQIGKQLKQVETANQGPTMVDPNSVVNMYAGMLNILRGEVAYVSLGIRPGAEVCNLAVRVKAVPETLMAKMLAGEKSGTENNLLGYLEDDALFNAGVKMNTSFWEELTLTNFDILRFLSDGVVSDQTIEKLERIVADMIASSGGPAALSMKFDATSPGNMPFAGQYVVSVKDAEKWNKAQQELMQLYMQGNMADVYRNMGIDLRQEIERGIDIYQGVSIDSVKQVWIPTDPNSDEGKLLDNIYKGGFDWRTAVCDGLWINVMGSDCDAGIRTLIDKIKSGGPRGIAPGVQACFDRLSGGSQLDFVGTVNVAEYLQMATMALDFMMADPNNPPPLPAAQYSESIAYGGRVAEGKLTVEMAVPKKHLQEVKEAAQLMGQKTTELSKCGQLTLDDTPESAEIKGEVPATTETVAVPELDGQ